MAHFLPSPNTLSPGGAEEIKQKSKLLPPRTPPFFSWFSLILTLLGHLVSFSCCWAGQDTKRYHTTDTASLRIHQTSLSSQGLLPKDLVQSLHTDLGILYFVAVHPEQFALINLNKQYNFGDINMNKECHHLKLNLNPQVSLLFINAFHSSVICKMRQ